MEYTNKCALSIKRDYYKTFLIIRLILMVCFSHILPACSQSFNSNDQAENQNQNQNQNQINQSELKVVPFVDLNRYQGTWYEIARLPHKHQDGCIKTQVEYQLKSGGDEKYDQRNENENANAKEKEVKVTNQCFVVKTQKTKIAQGRAWVVDQKTNAKLKVQFFLSKLPFRVPLVAGDYWIIDLDQENYSYVIISEPEKKLLWILARKPQMERSFLQQKLDYLKTLGFQLDQLIIEKDRVLN